MEKIVTSLPVEIWIHIFKYIDLPTLSVLNYTNTFFYKIISRDKWFFIDNMNNNFNLNANVHVPLTKETFLNYKYCIDWSQIILKNESTGNKIPENVIEWIEDKQDLEIISTYQKISNNLINKLFNKISYKNLINHQDLPLNILYQIANNDVNLNNTDWYVIWSKQKIDFNFIVSNINNVQWHPLSGNRHSVSFELINQYYDKIVWQEFTKHSINENILEKFIHKFDFICWNNISRFTELSNNFITKYITYLDLGSVFRYQKLSSELLYNLVDSFTLDEFEYYFQSICLYQKLSSDFIIKYKDKITLKFLIRNRNIPRSVLSFIYEN